MRPPETRRHRDRSGVASDRTCARAGEESRENPRSQPNRSGSTGRLPDPPAHQAGAGFAAASSARPCFSEPRSSNAVSSRWSASPYRVGSCMNGCRSSPVARSRCTTPRGNSKECTASLSSSSAAAAARALAKPWQGYSHEQSLETTTDPKFPVTPWEGRGLLTVTSSRVTVTSPRARRGCNVFAMSFPTRAVVCAVLAAFALKPAGADNFGGVHYDPNSDQLVVRMIYRGTNPDHTFSVRWGKCRPLGDQYQIAGEVLDSQWDDRARRDYSKILRIPLKNFACRPARVTLRTAPGFNYTLEVPPAR